MRDTASYIQTAFDTTYAFWKEWTAKITYLGLWKEPIIRSALVLKLLISHKYGAPVAAPTFSLP